MDSTEIESVILIDHVFALRNALLSQRVQISLNKRLARRVFF